MRKHRVGHSAALRHVPQEVLQSLATAAAVTVDGSAVTAACWDGSDHCWRRGMQGDVSREMTTRPRRDVIIRSPSISILRFARSIRELIMFDLSQVATFFPRMRRLCTLKNLTGNMVKGCCFALEIDNCR